MGRACWPDAGLLATLLLGLCSVLAVRSQAFLKDFKASISDPQHNLPPLSDCLQCCGWGEGWGELTTCQLENVVSGLDLSGLNLQGELRLDLLKSCVAITSVDLSNNFFRGSIPDGLATNLPYLVSLNLSGNNIHGPIPADIVECRFLNFLSLDRNNLTGTIPPQLGLLPRLKILDVSRNRLEGSIPTTLLNRSAFLDGTPMPYPEDAFMGNANLTVPSAYCKMFPHMACYHEELDARKHKNTISDQALRIGFLWGFALGFGTPLWYILCSGKGRAWLFRAREVVSYRQIHGAYKSPHCGSATFSIHRSCPLPFRGHEEEEPENEFPNPFEIIPMGLD